MGLALLALPLLAACGSGDAGSDSSRLHVLASNTIIADLVTNVAGPDAEVTSLIPSGADPHTFDPSPSDARRIAEADIVFVNGLGLESATVMDLIETNVGDEAPVVVIADELAELGLAPRDRDYPQADPHMWLDPARAERYADVMVRELTEMDSANTQGYYQRLAEFRGKLRRAASAASARIPTLEPSDSDVINAPVLAAAHSSFRYLDWIAGTRFSVLIVRGQSQEITPSDISDIVKLLREDIIVAVIVQPERDTEDRVLEQAAEDAGVPVCTLYSDALDDRVPTYLDLLRFNGEQLARCLGGEGG